MFLRASSIKINAEGGLEIIPDFCRIWTTLSRRRETKGHVPNMDIISKLSFLKEEEGRITDGLKEVLVRFNHTLDSMEKERLSFEDEILKITAGRNEIKEDLKVITRNTLVYEINIAKVRKKLEELEMKSASIKKYYESLFNGPVSNIFAVNNPDAEKKVTVDGAIDKFTQDDTEKVELLEKKRELMVAMNMIFSRYESEIGEVEKEKKMAMEMEGNFVKKDGDARKQKKILMSSFKTYSDEIKKYKMKLASAIDKEIEIVEEFTMVLKNIGAAVKISKRVSDILVG